jgi:Domain of unknown function DUF29
MKTSLYDTDFFAWSNKQAALLRAGKLAEADIENIAEEIESMGKTEKRELVSRLRVLLLHLLKWRYQPLRRGTSWKATVEIQRLDVSAVLKDNPSLKPKSNDYLAQAYKGARLEAMAETGLSGRTFPKACPWTIAQALDARFWPE